jgi:hypothetical protein
MARGTRMGEAFLSPGNRPVLPPSISSRTRRSVQSIEPASRLQVSTAIAVVATLNIEAALMQHLGGDLPPRIRAVFTALGPPEWTDVCRQAIRMQSRLLDEANGANRCLRQDEPWLLTEFLPTMRS